MCLCLFIIFPLLCVILNDKRRKLLTNISVPFYILKGLKVYQVIIYILNDTA